MIAHTTFDVSLEAERLGEARNVEQQLRDADERWFALLTAWRTTLCAELLALPSRIRDPHTLDAKRNLELSIRCIDFGLSVVDGTGYGLTNLRLGALMREARMMPWLGSLPEVEKRLAGKVRKC